MDYVKAAQDEAVIALLEMDPDMTVEEAIAIAFDGYPEGDIE